MRIIACVVFGALGVGFHFLHNPEDWKSITNMSTSPSQPEKHKLYEFFANPIVQGVAALIALGVAFSGRFSQNATVVMLLLAE